MVASSAACSSWAAAFCTVASVFSGLPRNVRIESRSFCAASGNDSTRLLASSLSEITVAPTPPRMPTISNAALMARGIRRACNQFTTGDSA